MRPEAIRRFRRKELENRSENNCSLLATVVSWVVTRKFTSIVLGRWSTAADDENSKRNRPCSLKFYNKIIAFWLFRQQHEASPRRRGTGFEMWALIP
jgi:hypothetical protein